MSVRDDTVVTYRDHTVAAALRALPDAGPQPDLWPDLARALGERRAAMRWRYALPVALAAAVALALLLPHLAKREPAEPTAPIATHTATTPPSPLVANTGSDELSKLHLRSQTLERWIAAVSAHAPQNSRDLMAAVEFEDLIGLVDLQLGATRSNADALPLWRQRVALLEDLATIRGSAFAIAANDAGATRTAPTSPTQFN
ncbi:MAG: hypothetical protein ABI082_09630 [Dokdonella sp.]